jgi:hypothetical protein
MSSSILSVLLLVSAVGFGLAEDEVPVINDAQLASAIRVEVDARCSESRMRKSDVSVSWMINEGVVTEGMATKSFLDADNVRVDISSAPGGLDIGRYSSVVVSAENGATGTKDYAVGGDASSVRFLDLSPGVMYHVRVLVLAESGWVSSAPSRFLTPVCAVDDRLRDERQVEQ